MTVDDYKLLINICQHSLRSNNLNQQQISDIDYIINKLSKTIFIKDRKNAVVRNKKMGQRARISSR